MVRGFVHGQESGGETSDTWEDETGRKKDANRSIDRVRQIFLVHAAASTTKHDS